MYILGPVTVHHLFFHHFDNLLPLQAHFIWCCSVVNFAVNLVPQLISGEKGCMHNDNRKVLASVSDGDSDGDLYVILQDMSTLQNYLRLRSNETYMRYHKID